MQSFKYFFKGGGLSYSSKYIFSVFYLDGARLNFSPQLMQGIGLLEIGLLAIGLMKIGPLEIGLLAIGLLETGLLEIGLVEIGLF